MRETRREMVIPQTVHDAMARAVAAANERGEARTVLRDLGARGLSVSGCRHHGPSVGYM